MNSFRHLRRPLLDGESVPPVRSLYEQLIGRPAPPPVPEPEADGHAEAEDDAEDDEGSAEARADMRPPRRTETKSD
jgi:hypothetical protein